MDHSDQGQEHLLLVLRLGSSLLWRHDCNLDCATAAQKQCEDYTERVCMTAHARTTAELLKPRLVVPSLARPGFGHLLKHTCTRQAARGSTCTKTCFALGADGGKHREPCCSRALEEPASTRIQTVVWLSQTHGATHRLCLCSPSCATSKMPVVRCLYSWCRCHQM